MATWAAYIADDLRTKIRTGRGLPESLTLKYLSRQYDVSLMPVRAAVNELLDEQLLQNRDNGRLVISRTKIGSGVPEDERPRLEPPKDHYDRIADDLVALSLRGRAVFVREEEAAERYGISRAAVRQEFTRLAGAGILEHVPRRGWRVRPFRQKELAAFIEAREALELKALELAWSRLEDDDLRAMCDGNALPETSTGQPVVDNSLHAYLIEKADNQYIGDFFDRHGKYYEAIFMWELGDRDSAIETVRQHRAVLEALLARDREAARKALIAHIRFNHPMLTVGRGVFGGDPEVPVPPERPGSDQKVH